MPFLETTRIGLLSILLLTPLTFVTSAEPNELGTRMNAVRFPSPPTPVGDTPAQQFTSVLRQISATYSAKWKQPLPVVLDVEAAYQIAHLKTDLKHYIEIPLSDVPLPEMLGGWCHRAHLRVTYEKDRIVISPEPTESPE